VLIDLSVSLVLEAVCFEHLAVVVCFETVAAIVAAVQGQMWETNEFKHIVNTELTVAT
jgi:hypothetical protein